MGKKNYDSLLHNILGGAEIRPQDRFDPPADEKQSQVHHPNRQLTMTAQMNHGNISPLSVP